MVQPEYRVYEMNKRLQSRTEVSTSPPGRAFVSIFRNLCVGASSRGCRLNSVGSVPLDTTTYVEASAGMEPLVCTLRFQAQQLLELGTVSAGILKQAAQPWPGSWGPQTGCCPGTPGFAGCEWVSEQACLEMGFERVLGSSVSRTMIF